MNGAELIAAERRRQVEGEGWMPEHDDAHVRAELAVSAAAYALEAANMRVDAAVYWPWSREWWKPSDDPIRNLVKAGALIAAEIDRLQRKGAQP